MVDLVGIGSLLSGAGAASKLFGGGPDYSNQAKNTLRGAFQAADEAGLHRLAVAGSPAGYSPVANQGAEGLMQAGQAMRDYGLSRRDKKNDAKQSELVDAQIEEARSRTILNQANARRALMGPQPGLGQARNPIGEAMDRLANGGPRQISREPERDMPARQTVTLGGNTAAGPNPEAFEVGVSELIAGLFIYGPQWLYNQAGGGRLNSNRSGSAKPWRGRPGAKPNQPGYRP